MRALAITSAMALTGCNSARESAYGQYGQFIIAAFKQSFGNGAVTRQQAAAVPYASMGYRLNSGRELLVVLATDTAGDLLWTSGQHIALMTRDGRIRRTVGLPNDVGAVTSPGDLASPSQALRAPFYSLRQTDFPDLGLFGVNIRCHAVARGRTSVSILSAATATVRVTETCRAEDLDWNFTDNFWVDPQSGMIWKAVQHIHPKGDILETELFRPPS